MAMKYVAAYLMCILGGNEHPGTNEVRSVLEAVDARIECDVLNQFLDSVKGKNYHELISEGLKKLQNIGGGSAATATVVATDVTETVKEEKKEVVEEEEEEDDLGFSLFG